MRMNYALGFHKQLLVVSFLISGFKGEIVHVYCVFDRDLPVPQPPVSVVVAAGAAAAAAGFGGGWTGGRQAAACLTQGAASWGWTSAERPPLKPDSEEKFKR